MGLFDNVGNAKAGSVQYIEPGQYLMKIDRCHIVETRKKRSVAAVDMTVIKILEDGSIHKVGHEVNWGVQDDSDYFGSEVKGFLEAVVGFDASEMDEATADASAKELCSQIFSSENPLANTVVELSATARVSQEGNPWTLRKFKRALSYEDVKSELSEEAAQRFFPGGLLDKLIEGEKQALASA